MRQRLMMAKMIGNILGERIRQKFKQKFSDVNWTSLLTLTALGVVLVLMIDAVTGVSWLAELVFVLEIIAVSVVIIAYGDNLMPDLFRPKSRQASRRMEDDVEADTADRIVPETESGNVYEGDH